MRINHFSNTSFAGTIRFGAGAYCAPIEVVPGTKVSPAFIQQVEAAAQFAFQKMNPLIGKALQQHGFKIQLSEFLSQGVSNSPQQDLSYMDQEGAVFLNVEVVRLAEKVKGKRAKLWQERTFNKENLAGIIGHEAMHYFDVIVGTALTGNWFSKSSLFKQPFLHRVQEAQASDLIPNPDVQVHDWGMKLFQYLPITSNIPEPFADWFDPPERNPIRYAEGFAELMLGANGLNGIDQAIFKPVCGPLWQEVPQKLIALLQEKLGNR